MHDHDDSACHSVTRSNLSWALFGNSFLAIVEGVVWVLSSSVTVSVAALHDSCDALTSLGMLVTDRVSHRYPKVPSYVALGSVLLVIIGCFISLCQATIRIFFPQPVEVFHFWELGLLGLGVNLFLAKRLEGGTSILEGVSSLHFYEDALAACVILIEALCVRWIRLETLDPILAIFSGLCICCLSINRLISVMDEIQK